MELILLEKVQKLGDLGEVVKVKSGYGRNFLLPTGKAVRATKKNIDAFEQRRTELEKTAADKLVAAGARARDLEGIELHMVVHASTEGKLYGSIGPREIADKLTNEGHAVQKGEVIMGSGSLRRVGEHEVQLHLHADVNVSVKLVIEGEE